VYKLESLFNENILLLYVFEQLLLTLL